MDDFVPTIKMLASTGADQLRFQEQARNATRAAFGNKVFIRGVVEISNYCRENCNYCGMRRDNRTLERHRADVNQIADILLNRVPDCVTDINIQGGEDPVAVREVALPLVRILKENTDLGISVSLGTLNEELYHELQSAGAGMYIMKFEISNEQFYRKQNCPGTLSERCNHIRKLADKGWFVSSGFIFGLPGQTPDDALDNFRLAKELPLNGCSVSPFIPGESTPLSEGTTANLDRTLNCMTALRLLNPNWIIPAVSALNLVNQECGYRRGLMAGANLCTLNLTPPELRKDYLIYKRDRFIMREETILKAIDACGLEPSTESMARQCWSNGVGV